MADESDAELLFPTLVSGLKSNFERLLSADKSGDIVSGLRGIGTGEEGFGEDGIDSEASFASESGIGVDVARLLKGLNFSIHCRALISSIRVA